MSALLYEIDEYFLVPIVPVIRIMAGNDDTPPIILRGLEVRYLSEGVGLARRLVASNGKNNPIVPLGPPTSGTVKF